MSDDSKARVDRLISFCKRRRVYLDARGEVSPAAISSKLKLEGYKGEYQYVRDVLAKEHRSFGASKAREVERALGMAYLYLEGGADWPFEEIDVAKVLALDPGKLRQLEGAFRLAAKQLGFDIEIQAAEPPEAKPRAA